MLRDSKEGEPMSPRRPPWNPCKYKMDDIGGHVVLATGDEDLGSVDGISTILEKLSAC
jgi:hypothetical protein